MTDLDTRLRAGFAKAYGGNPARVTIAPGRVNLIGEHTDYNDGFALPVPVAAETRVATRPRADREIRAIALDFADETDSFDIGASHSRTGSWRDYLRGIVGELAYRGIPLAGADLAIAGNIPRGTGLSSSASLEIALIQALCATELDPVVAALTGQAAENNFVGVRCGNLDQLAVAGAQSGAALLIDCRSLAITQVPLPADCAIVIVQSGIERGLVDGAYNQRRVECEDAARILGVAALRDADMAMLDAAAMPDTVFRRARHVISENDRVLAAAAALCRADYARLGQLMRESHVSMRDDFEITVPMTDALADFMNTRLGTRGGARQTGGGFGGAVVALTDTAGARDLEQDLGQSHFAGEVGHPTILLASTGPRSRT
ncbi:Galactokinase [Sphingomonas antarctica]|uniref:galactokinase n=1 Tax=Sphingomonas antarctica TaxID=2040274 RepID=UPI0039E7AEFA